MSNYGNSLTGNSLKRRMPDSLHSDESAKRPRLPNGMIFRPRLGNSGMTDVFSNRPFQLPTSPLASNFSSQLVSTGFSHASANATTDSRLFSEGQSTSKALWDLPGAAGGSSAFGVMRSPVWNSPTVSGFGNSHIPTHIRHSTSSPTISGGMRVMDNTDLPATNRSVSVNKDTLPQLTRSILSFYDATKQGDHLRQKKFELRNALFAICRELFPDSGLYIVGSSLNGYGSNSSDMDLCLMVSQRQTQRSEVIAILQRLRAMFRKCSYLQQLIVIRAKVPILKFNDRVSGIECDLNINNSVGIRNTHLLGVYGQMDARVRPLVNCVKFWANSQNINDAKSGTVSSYSLALMVINYLQCGVKPPALPSLQTLHPEQFNMSVDIRSLRLKDAIPAYTSTNHESVGELFLGFLRYYSRTFRFSEQAASVRLGQTLPITAVRRNFTEQWKHICIEEPFDLSNTARSVYDANVFRRIFRVFERSHDILSRTRDLESITRNPV